MKDKNTERYILTPSTAEAFKHGFTHRCGSCHSVFCLPPKQDYCPICNIYNIMRFDLEQIYSAGEEVSAEEWAANHIQNSKYVSVFHELITAYRAGAKSVTRPTVSEGEIEAEILPYLIEFDPYVDWSELLDRLSKAIKELNR